MKRYQPEIIYIETAVRSSPITRRVLRSLPDVMVEEIDASLTLLEDVKEWHPSLTAAKKSLLLAEQKGEFFRPCPGQQSKGASRNVCCNYFVINFASNCHMECSYCYLQAYLNFPHMVVYANIEKLLEELRYAVSGQPDQYFRVGTGELADSLALDSLTGYSQPLVEFFAEQPNAILELKTKTDCIENLLGLDHRGHTVVAWSLNPPFIQETEEHKTSTIGDRFSAAKVCVEAGYPVAFHFDPIIHYPSWKKDYEDLIRETFERIPVNSIAWISLGALRMPDTLKKEIRERFPSSLLPLGELIPAGDGKLRYFKPIRTEIYHHMRSWIAELGAEVPVYACMERPEVWSRVFGVSSPSNVSLGNSLVQVVL
jgi:spore photoproduct lyase